MLGRIFIVVALSLGFGLRVADAHPKLHCKTYPHAVRVCGFSDDNGGGGGGSGGDNISPGSSGFGTPPDGWQPNTGDGSKSAGDGPPNRGCEGRICPGESGFGGRKPAHRGH
jgi:hypothetical protein